MTYTLETFYTSKAWTKLRLQLMDERTNEDGVLICEHCGKPILKRYDCQAHHKIELTEENVNDAMISLNPDNVILIHLRCHNDIHDRFHGRPEGLKNKEASEKFRQRVYLIHGAPCSGKNTYLRMNANPDDLVMDLDAIYQAISLCGVHEQPFRIKPVAFAVRAAVLDSIRIRKGLWKNAWILTSKTGLDLAREIETFRATPIHIDTDRKECLKRLHDHPNGRDIEKWTRYIDDYFEREALQADQDAPPGACEF